MKIIKTAIASVMLLAMLTACGKEPKNDTVPVTSVYPNLTALEAGEFPYDDIDLWQDPDYPYADCRCIVSELRGKLVITDKLDYHNAVYGISRVARAGDHWGDDTGIFHQDANGDNEVVTTESLVGFIHCYTENRLLAITGGINGGTLHLIDKNEPEKHETLSFTGIPMAFSYAYTDKNYDPPKHFYIAADTALLHIDMENFLTSATPSLSDIKITPLSVPDYWGHLDINSMCEIDGILYMGTQMGVLAFDTVYYDCTYYPVDYETVFSK